MKKVFFAFVVTAGVVLTACNNKPAATDATPAADTTAVKAAVTTTAPADSTKPMATDSAAATAATGTK